MRRALALPAALLIVASLLLAVPGGPAAAQQPPDYAVDPATLPFEALPGTQTQRYWGVDDNGAGYRIEVPEGWNGDLVLYAHGFRGVEPELTVDDPEIRAYLVANGYAWAASSYRANGYAVEEGVEDTENLIGIFAEETGRPAERTFLHGVSMGGHITGASIERYPDTYAGALPLCGVMGDVALYDYFQDTNLVAQALAGVEASTPPGPDYLSVTVPAIREALDYPGDLTGPGHQFAAAVEQLSGGERPGFEESLAFWSQTETGTALAGQPFLFGIYGGALTGGQTDPRVDAVVGNVGRTYQYDTSPEVSPEEAELNQAVTRDPAVAGAQPPFPVITGDLPVPVLSMHTVGDLFVPFSMEQVYAAEAAANGDEDLLVARAIRDVRHCGFAVQEIEAAFADLVAWVDGGPRPEGDDVLDPAAVADRDFGCAFTLGDREGFPTCGAPVTTARSQGADRVGTALAVAADAFDRARTVVLARADDHADALAGAPLAGRLAAPVLLTFPDRLAEGVAQELARLGAEEVVLLGGVEALSPAVAGELEARGLTVDRVEGADRFATAAAIARRVGGDDAFLVLGGRDAARGWADAVAASGLAAFLSQPVLLTDAAGLPAATSAALEDLGVDRVTVVGGPVAVPEEVLDDLPGDAEVERLYGEDRYATSAAVAQRSVASGAQPNRPWVATGTDWPDALAAGPAAAASGDTLLLVDGQDAAQDTATLDLLRDRGRVVTVLRLAGGPLAITPAVEAALLAATA